MFGNQLQSHRVTLSPVVFLSAMLVEYRPIHVAGDQMCHGNDPSDGSKQARSRMCFAGFGKPDRTVILLPIPGSMHQLCRCFSSSPTAGRSKGEATQGLSHLEEEVCLTGRVLRAVVSCLCFCSHWYFLIVTSLSFRLSFLIP